MFRYCNVIPRYIMKAISGVDNLATLCRPTNLQTICLYFLQVKTLKLTFYETNSRQSLDINLSNIFIYCVPVMGLCSQILRERRMTRLIWYHSDQQSHSMLTFKNSLMVSPTWTEISYNFDTFHKSHYQDNIYFNIYKLELVFCLICEWECSDECECEYTYESPVIVVRTLTPIQAKWNIVHSLDVGNPLIKSAHPILTLTLTRYILSTN